MTGRRATRWARGATRVLIAGWTGGVVLTAVHAATPDAMAAPAAPPTVSSAANPALASEKTSEKSSEKASVNTSPLPPAEAPSAAEATALLAALNAAAQKRDYDGTFVFQRSSTVQSSHIVHFVDGANGQYQRTDGLDGKPRSVVQHNNDLFTFLPETRTVIVDTRKGQDNFPALLSGNIDQVLQVYRPSIAGRDRVAGWDCAVVLLTPRDDYRYAYRLSIEPHSGLLLRAQTLDTQQQVLEQVAFSQIQMKAPSREVRTAIRDSVHLPADWKVVRAPVMPVDMEASGWKLDPGVPGFHKILELRRPMAAAAAGLPPIPVDQAVFSDGVTAVSVFAEPSEKTDRQPGEGRSGATHLLAQQQGRFWMTFIGEVPETTLRTFADSIQFHDLSAHRTP